MDGNGKMEHGTVTGISLIVLHCNVGFFDPSVQVHHFHTLSRTQSLCACTRILGFKATVE
jgi:hypothetical protein